MVVEPAFAAVVGRGPHALEAADDLRALLDGIADAVTVQTPDQRLVYANEAATRLYRIPRGGDLAGFSTETYLRGFDVSAEDGGPLDVERLPGRLALAGREPEPVTIRARDRTTGQVVWARVKATAVRDAAGDVRLAINLVEDITELKRSEQAQRFLAEASRRLAGTLDYERTLAAIAALAVPTLGDRCRVLLDDASPGRRVEVSTARLGLARPMPPSGAIELRAVTLARYPTYDLRPRPGRGLRRACRRGPGERAALPGGRGDRARAADLAAAATPAGDPGAELAAAYHPAWDGLEVGGDFYDVFTTGEGQWYLVIGDVCGKGAEAAAVTALARYTLRSAAARRRSPAAILRWVATPCSSRRRRRALLHDRLRPRRPHARPGARHGGLRRPSAPGAAARLRARAGSGRAGHAARVDAGPGAAGSHGRAAPR